MLGLCGNCEVLCFFPRASERRVLLIVGVCQTFFTYSHLHITSYNLHIFSSSHLHSFSSSHLLIFSSSHLRIFSSSHLHILTSSHLLIFSSSHLLIFTSSHPHIFTFSLALLLSCPLALSFFSISLLKAQGNANETARNATFSHESRFDRPSLKVKLRFPASRRNPFARNGLDRQKLV